MSVNVALYEMLSKYTRGSAGKNRGHPKTLGLSLFHGSEIRIKLFPSVWGEEGRCYIKTKPGLMEHETMS